MSSSGEFSRSSAPCGGAGLAGFGVYIDEALGGGCVVRVAGELDCATAGLMGEALLLASEMPGDRLVIDVSRLTFMGVAGLRVLLAADERLVTAGGGGLVVRGASGIVRRLFELTGFFGLLDDRDPQLRLSYSAAIGGGGDALELARRDAGLSVADLFVAYFALGGAADHGQLVAYLNGDAEVLDRHQRDIAVHAVNEHLGDVGRTEQLLSYASA